jgi:hypothetical protein
MKHCTFPAATAALFLLIGCDATNLGSGRPGGIQTIGFAQDAPADAAAGTCWGKTISPAIIETVTREVLLKPAQVSSDGRVQQPAVYKKEDVLDIVQPRRETWFETVCPRLLTEGFVASLQRALAARGGYRGNVTGLMDDRTRRAIRKFQLGGGFDSGNLTVESARTLGLVVVPRDTQ